MYNTDAGRAAFSQDGGYDPNSTGSSPNQSASYLASRYPSIVNAYQGATGRMPTDADILSQTGNGSFAPNDPRLQYSVGNIYNSDEAQAFRQKSASPNLHPSTADNGGGGGNGGNSGGGPPPAIGSPVSATGQIPPGMPAGPAPTYTPTQFKVQQPAPYQAPSTLPGSYGGYQFTQFTAPDQSGVNGDQTALMRAILANPATMNPAVIAQLDEANKEQALSMQQQQQQQLDQSAAARGTVGSGAGDALRAALAAATQGNILTGNRNIDIQAAQTNRQDQLNALGASSALAQDQLSRAINGYDTTLQGQQTQAADSRAVAQDAINRALSLEGLRQAAANSALQGAQFNLGAQQAQAGENQAGYQSRFAGYNADVAKALSIMQFLEGQRQFNDTNALQWGSLDQSGQNSVLDFLRWAYGG